MDIKNKLKQMCEGSIRHQFYIDLIRHCSLEYLMTVVVLQCNTSLISSALDKFSMPGTKQTIETHD